MKSITRHEEIDSYYSARLFFKVAYRLGLFNKASLILALDRLADARAKALGKLP